MIRQLLHLLLAICIAAQAANALDPHPTPIHHVPRRLRQTRLFVPTERSTDELLANDYYGNPLGPKATGHMRLLLQNPNKISAQDDFVDFQHMCQRMLAHDVDIFGLPETGVDWKQGLPPESLQSDPERLLATLASHRFHKRHPFERSRTIRRHLHRRRR
jgi:hypothetical protein